MKPKGHPISRRDFLKLTAYTLGLGSFAFIGGAGYATQVEPAWLEVVRLSLKLPRLDPAFAGFRLVQISDIHMGGWMNRARLAKAVQVISNESPDLVAITGDYLLSHGWDDARERALDDVAAALKPLVESFPVLTVMGNHDYWTDAKRIRDKLHGTGILELSNSVHSLRRGDAAFHICGLDDVYERRDDLDGLLACLPSDGAAILLCHEPDFADSSAETGRFDLQISGHTHGGQVVLPFVGPIHTPKYGHKYPLGLYKVGGMLQYTNRGIGMARIPVRFNCRPEITVFTFESEV
ncbi:MAG: metallophosphoesterase [Anaerolineaceae bacterium]|nr:MAG: metallophosphoesterase [Anaerolineaceae bacterium]